MDNSDDLNIVIRETTARVNTVLEERAFLDFYFPNPNIGLRRVAMWENPNITESRKPNYASQAIVQRGEPARLYVGSEARKVKVSFNYTLPHVETFFYMNQNKPKGWLAENTLAGGDTTKNVYVDFLVERLGDMFGGTFNITNEGGYTTLVTDGERGPRPYEGTAPVPGIKVPSQSPGGRTLQEGLGFRGGMEKTPLFLAVAYTHFVLDTIRASVIGDTVNDGVVYGPPIVRFRFGTVFDEAPFIVRNFSIKYAPDKGYDVRTMLSRQISIDLELEEFHPITGAAHGDLNDPLPGAGDILDLSNESRRRSLEL